MINGHFKGPTKQMQHFNTTYCNIIVHNMLHMFGHPVAICCNMLDGVGSSLKMVNFSRNSFWMLHDIVLVRPSLYNGACALVRFAFSKCHPTCCNVLQQGGQTCATIVVHNNLSLCFIQVIKWQSSSDYDVPRGLELKACLKLCGVTQNHLYWPAQQSKHIAWSRN